VDASVRTTAVEILSGHANPAALQTVAVVLAQESGVSVRRAAILGLGSIHAQNLTARQMLEGVSEQDPNGDLRQLAADLLAGGEAGA
jgi:HEAT repeat protein